MPDYGRPPERISGNADIDDVWSELTGLRDQIERLGTESLARQAIMIELLARIADAVDPPETPPDATSLYTETVLRVPKRRRPPLRGGQVTKG